jgi:prepilin signal peptidase PulO-like enzyme (type II secretory pathway)
MTIANLFACLGFGLSANIAAELLLVIDLKHPLASLDPTHRRMRVVRWLACMAGSLLIGFINPSPAKLILFALFSVSAATDFETSLLPPDWFIYGATLAGLAAGFITGGLPGLRDTVVAQAVCFAFMVLAVLLANAADSGDIKLLMQYGAACGSLYGVGIGIASEFAVRFGILVVAFLGLWFVRRSGTAAFRDLSQLRTPHGPIAWIGLALAIVSSQISTTG